MAPSDKPCPNCGHCPTCGKTDSVDMAKVFRPWFHVNEQNLTFGQHPTSTTWKLKN